MELAETPVVIEELRKRRSALHATEVALLLNVPKRTIYHLASRGRLPSFSVGKAIRFDPLALIGWLKKRGLR